MAINPATARLKARNTTPSAPPPDYVLLYFKTDNVLYIQGSDGVEVPIGTANGITQLSGDVTGVGPGNAVTTVVQVGGKLAAEIAQSVTDTQAATSLNVASTIVKRDASGNVFVSLINGVTIESHASRHLPLGADPLTTAAPVSNLNADTVNQTGTANSLARSDHSHDLDTGTPVTQNTDQSNFVGSSSDLAKADHVHNIPTATAVGLNANSTNTQGSSSNFAKADHTHDLATGVPSTQAPDQANAEGTSVNLARADHVHNIPANVPIQANADGTNLEGVSTSFARADHKHDILAAAPISQTPDQANALGIAASLALSDHVHNIPTIAPVTQNADQANADGSSANFSRSDHIHNIPTAAPVQANANGSNDQGVSSNFSKADHKHDVLTAAASTQTPDQANAAGSSSSLARADHVHNVPTAAPSANLSATTTNAQGVAASFSRSDHSHDISTGAVSTQNADQANAEGTSVNLARADHVHNIPTAAPVQANANGSNDQGVSSNFSKADHKHDVLTAAASTQTPDQANAAGSSSSLARADHVHNIPAATPVQVGTTNFKGAAASFALSDHVHDHGPQTSPTLHAVATPSANGFMSSTDKAKVDAAVPSSLGTANQVLGVNAGASASEYKSVLPTTNQTTVTHGVGSITIGAAQDIATTSRPTFSGENLTDRLELTEQTAPSTPASTKIDVFAEASNGFTRLRALDSTGLKATILRDTIILVKNVSGSTIAAGKGIYYTGTDAGSNLPTIGLAKADSSSTVPCIGVTVESIPNNGTGRVMALGIVQNIDTSAFAQGDKLYLSASTAGAFTATKPSAPNIWQRIGIVLISNVSTGAIEVRPFATHGEESGTNTGFALNSSTLTDGATVTIDASTGNDFRVTLGGNRTLTIINPVRNGQKIVLEVIQDGTGGRTLTLDSNFVFGLDILNYVASVGANKTDLVGFRYSSASGKWQVVALSKGF